jgi:RNase adaptor protein for sRNA GlmZ degradation
VGQYTYLRNGRGYDVTSTDRALRVAIVGPCSAGKSTLRPAVTAAGYEVRQPAQEHSLVPDMWLRMSRPDILIYLDVSYVEARRRRPHIDGGPQRLAEQHRRLNHARARCNLYVDTSELTPAQVRDQVLSFLTKHRP